MVDGCRNPRRSWDFMPLGRLLAPGRNLELDGRRMWGFCAEKEQRMLVYEYIPNGSLDKFLFPNEEVLGDDTTDDSKKRLITPRPLLDWSIRYRIALGVARAIAYLHEECLEWVLHCDIKPENILLEDDFCPKVSDFGRRDPARPKSRVGWRSSPEFRRRIITGSKGCKTTDVEIERVGTVIDFEGRDGHFRLFERAT